MAYNVGTRPKLRTNLRGWCLGKLIFGRGDVWERQRFGVRELGQLRQAAGGLPTSFSTVRHPVLQVWRDGQRKRVFVYRFLSTGSIEEKVYQRQLSKEGLKQLVSKNGGRGAGGRQTAWCRRLLHAPASHLCQ